MNVELNVNALGKALQRLDESLAYDLAQPLVVDACIQRFEFCIELTWKTLKKCLAAYSGAIRTPIPALPGQSFRDKPDTDSAINQPF